MPVKKGDKVTVEYTATLADGTVCDSTENKGPITFTVGTAKVIEGLDDAVIGMEKGQEKRLKIRPEKAFGKISKRLIKTMPKQKLPQDVKQEKGESLILKSPDGHQYSAIIKEVKEKEVILDLNHPLAGKTLNLRLKVVDYQ